jgi:hypothetical protein
MSDVIEVKVEDGGLTDRCWHGKKNLVTLCLSVLGAT